MGSQAPIQHGSLKPWSSHPTAQQNARRGPRGARSKNSLPTWGDLRAQRGAPFTATREPVNSATRRSNSLMLELAAAR
jgi:hypothetical protein